MTYGDIDSGYGFVTAGYGFFRDNLYTFQKVFNSGQMTLLKADFKII